MGAAEGADTPQSGNGISGQLVSTGFPVRGIAPPPTQITTPGRLPDLLPGITVNPFSPAVS